MNNKYKYYITGNKLVVIGDIKVSELLKLTEQGNIDEITITGRISHNISLSCLIIIGVYFSIAVSLNAIMCLLT